MSKGYERLLVKICDIVSEAVDSACQAGGPVKLTIEHGSALNRVLDRVSMGGLSDRDAERMANMLYAASHGLYPVKVEPEQEVVEINCDREHVDEIESLSVITMLIDKLAPAKTALAKLREELDDLGFEGFTELCKVLELDPKDPMASARGIARRLADTERRRVVIESPYAGDVAANTAYARRCLLDSLSRNEAPLASHLLYTQVLNDDVPAERAAGIGAGLSWFANAQAVILYTDLGTSPGMAHAIVVANRIGLRIEFRKLDSEV